MDKALQTMIKNMPEKTGKSLEQWKSILKTIQFNKHSEAVNFLKKDHGITHGYANTIVNLSKEDKNSKDDLVDQQYKGKETLITIYEQIIALVTSFGKDVKVVPKKTTVSIVRNRQFALIKPASKSRIDLGLKLRNRGIGNRLENSGPFGTMCTHRVKLTGIEEIDNELKEWLKEAYNEAQ